MKGLTRILILFTILFLFSCGRKAQVSEQGEAEVTPEIARVEKTVVPDTPLTEAEAIKSDEGQEVEEPGSDETAEIPEEVSSTNSRPSDGPETTAVEPLPGISVIPVESEPVEIQAEPESVGLWLTLIPYHRDTFKAVPDGESSPLPETAAPPQEQEGYLYPADRYAVLPDKWRKIVIKTPASPGRSSDPLPPEGYEGLAAAEEPAAIAVVPPEEVPDSTAPEEPVPSGEPQVIAIAPPLAEPEVEEAPTLPAEESVLREAEAPEIPQMLEGGPRIVLDSPQNKDYYMSSLLLEGECLPGEGLDDEKARVRTMTWKIPGMGDWSNPVFMEEDGQFQIDLVTSSLEGPQILILESEDFAGRISRRTIELQDGNRPPSIQLENSGDERSYGAFLSIRGSLDDPYQGIPELEGFSSLKYRLVSQDRASKSETLTGEISIDSSGDFFGAVNMKDRVGEQVLLLEVQGKNGSRSSKQIRLVPGTGDIPSFAIEPQDGRLSFSWEEVPGALEQNLYISDKPVDSPEKNPTAQFGSIQSPLVVDGTVNGHLYRAKLEILTEDGRFWSEMIEGIPLAPGTLDLSAQGGFEQVKLSWKSIPGSDHFRIWRRSDEQSEFSVLVPDVAGQEYIDATATFGTTYFYRIEPAGVSGPLSFSVPASSVETPSDKITLSSNYRQIIPEKIAVLGDYAYVAAGEGGFHIMDISTPQKPVSIGFLDQMGVKDVYIGPEYVYLASGSRGFQVVNIEEPTKPYEVLSRVTSDAVSIVGREDLVYVADSRLGLQIFDISDRQNPERLSSYRDADIKQLELQGAYLYAATGEGGMIMLDISNPYVPKVAASFSDYPVYDIFLQNGMVYLACGSRGMVILQDAGQGEWKELSRYPSQDARMIRLWEDYAMIADGSGGMKAVDVRQPSDPRFYGAYRGTDIKALAMSDEYALLADVSGLKVVRTYLFGQSFVQDRWETPGRSYGVMVEGERLWVADRQGGVSVYQSNTPSGMNKASLIRTFPTDFAEDILIQDEVLYVADGPGGIKLFYLGDPSQVPFLSIPVNGRVRRILPFGDQIAALSSEEGVVFLNNNIGNSDSVPSLKFASRFYSSDPRDAVFSGNTLFLGDHRDGLIVAEKMENQFFELERFGEYKGISQLFMDKEVLYVLHSKGISLLDVHNPESPRLLSFIPSTEGESMQKKGDLLYLSEGFRGVSVYRLGPDHQGQKVSVCEDVFVVDAAPRGDYVYAADMDGVSVIKVIVPDWK